MVHTVFKDYSIVERKIKQSLQHANLISLQILSVGVAIFPKHVQVGHVYGGVRESG